MCGQTNVTCVLKTKRKLPGWYLMDRGDANTACQWLLTSPLITCQPITGWSNEEDAREGKTDWVKDRSGLGIYQWATRGVGVICFVYSSDISRIVFYDIVLMYQVRSNKLSLTFYFAILNRVLRVHFLNWYGHKNSPIKRLKIKNFNHKKTIPHTTMEKSLYKWWVWLYEVLHGNFYSRTFWNHEKCSTTCGTICLTFLHTTNKYV